MRLGLRLLLGFFLVTGMAGFFVMRVFVAEVKPSVREVMEDIMVDTANILAELATDDLAAMPPGGDLQSARFASRVMDYAARPIDAGIWGFSKQSLDFRVYVTDTKGRVVFDTGLPSGGNAVGQDYSRWRDVAKTLSGQYGARSTREVVHDDRSTTMYVAAPVMQGQQLLGVLTVAKPNRTVQKFIDRAEQEILIKGAWLLAFSLLVGVLVTGWVIWSVRRLRHYAQHVQWGERQVPPVLSGELGELARAMGAMRDRLDGHEHVEHLVRAMTHELKSPLTAIGGAAELLQDPLPDADRQRFASQISEQVVRLQDLVDRLLELSKLEHRHALDHMQPVDLRARMDHCLQTHTTRLALQGLHVQQHGFEELDEIQGDPELLDLALGNVLDNAMAFAPRGSTIDFIVEVNKQSHDQVVSLTVRDHGTGVPDYALARLGERFYSTPRPGAEGQAGRKGSGLGLAIVKRVMQLHGGSVHWANAHPGFAVTLSWPHAKCVPRP